jgi:hypothetical protein
MYNELFESVIRTSGENTDDIDDFDDRGNFWAKNPLFEWVLKEAGIEPIPNSPTYPTPASNNFPQHKNPQEKPENEKEPPEKQEEKKPFKEPHQGNIICGVHGHRFNFLNRKSS